VTLLEAGRTDEALQVVERGETACLPKPSASMVLPDHTHSRPTLAGLSPPSRLAARGKDVLCVSIMFPQRKRTARQVAILRRKNCICFHR